MDGEQRLVGRCRIWWREQTGKVPMYRADRWMESGGPETAPAPTQKCVVPLMVARGLFSCCNKSCITDTIVEEGEAHIAGILSSVPLYLSPLWEAGAASIWITTARYNDFLSHDALKSVALFIRMLFTTPPALLSCKTHRQSNYSDHL